MERWVIKLFWASLYQETDFTYRSSKQGVGELLTAPDFVKIIITAPIEKENENTKFTLLSSTSQYTIITYTEQHGSFSHSQVRKLCV